MERMRTRGGFKSKLVILLTLAVLSTTSAALLPQISQGEQEALTRTPKPLAFTFPAQAVADFDGDHLPDRAELVSNGYDKKIHLTLSSLRVTVLHFSLETQQPGSIFAEDIDRDSHNDLIWVSDPQATHTALWLNNGVGELARVSETATYAAEIKRLVAGGTRNGYLASFAGGQLRATATRGFYLLALPDDPLPWAAHSTALKSSPRGCAAALSPCVNRYPKRGPPSFLS